MSSDLNAAIEQMKQKAESNNKVLSSTDLDNISNDYDITPDDMDRITNELEKSGTGVCPSPKSVSLKSS